MGVCVKEETRLDATGEASKGCGLGRVPEDGETDGQTQEEVTLL